VLLVVTLPARSILLGAVILAAGALIRIVLRTTGGGRPHR
jgi:hypothetical protein